MATEKPTKPTNLMPTSFADNGIKNNFSSFLKENGFSPNTKQVLQGDNLNYMLDAIGRQLNYLTKVVDYLNGINIGKVPYVNNNNELDMTDIDGLLPSQKNNAGKFLTTNGATASWSSSLSRIGDPLFTLDFRTTGGINNIVASSYTDLVNNNKSYIWLNGTQYDIPTQDTDLLYEIYQIYGVTYGGSIASGKFAVPNMNNRVIWGGSTAGYIDAGLPNIKGFVYGSAQINSTKFDNAWNAQIEKVRQNAFTVRGKGVEISNSGEKDNMYNFDASRCSDVYKNNINTVQPPAIKVRAYTRVR